MSRRKKSNFNAPRIVPHSGQSLPVGKEQESWGLCSTCKEGFYFTVLGDDAPGCRILGKPLGQPNKQCPACFEKMQEENRAREKSKR